MGEYFKIAIAADGPVDWASLLDEKGEVDFNKVLPVIPEYDAGIRPASGEEGKECMTSYLLAKKFCAEFGDAIAAEVLCDKLTHLRGG